MPSTTIATRNWCRFNRSRVQPPTKGAIVPAALTMTEALGSRTASRPHLLSMSLEAPLEQQSPLSPMPLATSPKGAAATSSTAASTLEDYNLDEVYSLQTSDVLAREIAEWLSLEEGDWHWIGCCDREPASLYSVATSLSDLVSISTTTRTVTDTQLRLIAIQLLASCWTSLQTPAVRRLPDTFYARRHSQTHPNSDRFLHLGVSPDPLMISALQLQSLHRFSPAPGTHARDNSIVMAWPSFDGAESREEDPAVDVSKRRSLKELENEADKEETLEDFLKWTCDTPLDLEEVSRSRRRRGSAPSVSFPQRTGSDTRQRDIIASPSRTLSLSRSHVGKKPISQSLEVGRYTNGNVSNEPSNQAAASTRLLKKAPSPTRTNLSKAVQDTFKPLHRITNIRIRRHHSNPQIVVPFQRPNILNTRKTSSLDQAKALNPGRPKFYFHVQPHTRRTALPHISHWAHDVRRASSVAPLETFQRGKQYSFHDDGDDIAITAQDFKRYSVPPIEVLDDDVSSRCSGALDLLTAEEYLRQTAFDNCLDDGSRSLSGEEGQ